MSIQREIVKRLFESKHLPDDLPLDDVRLSETVVVSGNWYWKSKGKCWTQPTDKSSPRKEIEEDEYREICAKAKNGVTDISTKKDEPSKSNLDKVSASTGFKTSEELKDALEKRLHTVMDEDDHNEYDVEDYEILRVSDPMTHSSNRPPRIRITAKVTGQATGPDGKKMPFNKEVILSTEYTGEDSKVSKSSKTEEPVKVKTETIPKDDSPEPPKKKVTKTSWDNKFTHSMKQHQPLRRTSPTVKKTNTALDTSADLIDKYARDEETVASVVGGKQVILDLGNSDVNNEELADALRKSGFKQASRYRYIANL